jgi:hypothetical protein
MAGKRKRKRKTKVRRLYKIQPYENAFVSYGANDRPFAVVKEASIMKIDAKAFLEGLAALNQVGNVLKQEGQLDDDAQKKVAGDIGGALDILAKAGALEALDNKPVDPTKLEAKLGVVFGKVDQLALSLQAVDLNLADYASALKEDIQTAVSESSQAPPPAAPTPAAAAATEPPAATTEPPAEAAPEEEPSAAAAEAAPEEEPPVADPPAERGR